MKKSPRVFLGPREARVIIDHSCMPCEFMATVFKDFHIERPANVYRESAN